MQHMTRSKLGVLAAIAAGLVLGAVFGQPGTGRAASAAVPKNKTAPTISGTAAVGQKLTATPGTWSGNPTSYHYAWKRCDKIGAACYAIGGATSKTYTVTSTDAGHTLRVTVTAQNSSGSASATSAATAVVPSSVPGCPAGTGTIPVDQLTPPQRLQIVSGKSLRRVTRKSQAIQLRFEVTACNGRPVQGVTVFASPVPYNQFAGASGTTAGNGTVKLTEARRSGFPASRHQRLLAVFVRATKPGEPETGGVSTRRLFAFPVSLG